MNTENNDLMGFFEEGLDLELNLDDNLEIEQTSSEEETSEEENEINNTGEDQSDSEEVAGEDQEDEGSDTDDEESDDVSPDDNLYSSFASVLVEKGLLPSLDLENSKISTIDDLTETLRSEVNNQAKQYLIEKVGEEGYEALEKGISLAEYQNYQNNVNTLDNIDDDVLENDLELAKQIIKQDYISQGMTESRVNRILKKSIDLGEDVVLEDAKESLQSLKAIQAMQLEKLAEQRQEQQNQQKLLQEKIDNDLKNSIYNQDEYFENLKVNKDIKDKVYNSITKIVSTNPDTGVAENKLMRSRRENPIEFDKKLYYLYEITDGFTNISKLINKSESKAASRLEQQLRKSKFESSGAPAFMDDPESYDGPSGELVL